MASFSGTVCLGSLDTLFEDANQLVTLAKNKSQMWILDQPAFAIN
jgi:hypothetical protein